MGEQERVLVPRLGLGPDLQSTFASLLLFDLDRGPVSGPNGALKLDLRPSFSAAVFLRQRRCYVDEAVVLCVVQAAALRRGAFARRPQPKLCLDLANLAKHEVSGGVHRPGSEVGVWTECSARA